MTSTVAYKVFRRTEHDTLVSCSTEHSDLMVQYQTEGWTEAPIGGLLVFSNRASADSFACGLQAKTNEQFEVWECEAEELVSLPDFRVIYTDLTNAVRWLWRQVTLRIPLCGFAPWPTDTQAFKRVRLLKRCGK